MFCIGIFRIFAYNLKINTMKFSKILIILLIVVFCVCMHYANMHTYGIACGIVAVLLNQEIIKGSK